MSVVYPNLEALWDALMADYGIAGSYALAIEEIYSRTEFAERDSVKLLWIMRAATLGTDITDGASTVVHDVEATGEPEHTICTTEAVLNSDVGSYGKHFIARAARFPDNGMGGTLVQEFRVKMAQTAEFAMVLGNGGAASAIPPAAPGALFHYDSSVGPNFYARSYQAAQELSDTGIAADTDWHVFRIETTASAVRFYIDGALVATHTVQIPEAGLAVALRYMSLLGRTLAAAAKIFKYEYAAVWNEV